MNQSRRNFLLFFATVGLLATAPAVFARRGGRSRLSLGRGLRHGEPCPAKAPILSYSALERCIDLDEQINTGMGDLNAQESDLRNSARDIDELGKLIDRQRPRVDHYSQQSVDAYNQMVDEHRVKVEAYNAAVSAANQSAEPTNKLVNSFNQACAKRCYYVSDMDSILNARHLPMKK